MKSVLFFSLLATSFLVNYSCSSKKTATASEISNNNSKGKTDNADSLFASLDRGYCFGACSVYKVEIYQSGYAVYTGKANTDMVGTFTSHFSKEQLNSLINVALEINYFSLDDVYDNAGVTDLPSHTSSIVIDGKRKEVMRRYNFPQSIVAFEKHIDALVAENEWKFVAKSE